MSNLSRRLQKLEAQLTDRSGLIPYSEEWFEYWTERAGEFLEGENSDSLKGMTLDFIDALLERVRREDREVSALSADSASDEEIACPIS